jgi:hypothetical protein
VVGREGSIVRDKQRSLSSEIDRAGLREVVMTINRQLCRLAIAGTRQDHQHAQRRLEASWAQLVALLDPGTLPDDVRECPRCTHLCQRTATRCGLCWGKLPPSPPSSAPAAPVEQQN